MTGKYKDNVGKKTYKSNIVGNTTLGNEWKIQRFWRQKYKGWKIQTAWFENKQDDG